MAFWFDVVSGEGIAQLDGGVGHFISAYEYQLPSVTSPRVRVLDQQIPHRYQYAGLGGIAQGTIGVDVVVIDHWNFNFQHLYHVYTGPYTFSSLVFWKLPMGVSWGLAVYW